ncbi:MAG: hypothetical protein ABH956_03515 [Candidatus Nealsonbacteria bacterium]
MKIKSFDYDLYKKISVSDLILFCIYSIDEKNEKAEFERIVKECFELFPNSFSLLSISIWPDSRKLDRSLRALRNNKLIEGNPKTIFSLTKSGRKIAENIANIFRQKKLKL